MAKPIVGWFEVTGKDGPALQGFYSKLFDWEVNDAADGSGYGLVAASEKAIADGIGASQDGGPGQVTFYVEVDDPAGYLAKAEKLGGHTIVPPSEAMRKLTTEIDVLDQHAADHFGVNRTDLRLIDILRSSGSLSASQLASETAITVETTGPRMKSDRR